MEHYTVWILFGQENDRGIRMRVRAMQNEIPVAQDILLFYNHSSKLFQIHLARSSPRMLHQYMNEGWILICPGLLFSMWKLRTDIMTA